MFTHVFAHYRELLTLSYLKADNDNMGETAYVFWP